MARFDLIYETIQYSPYFGTDDPDLPAQIRGAAKAGFAGIGVDHRGTLSHFTQKRGSLRDIAELLGEHGLRCFAVQDLTVTEDERETLELAERCSEAAAALRAEWVHCCFTAPIRDETLALFRRALEIARPAGARFSLEFLAWGEMNDVARTREVIRRAAQPDVAMLVDTWHARFGPTSWEDLASLTTSELAYLQFDDHPRLASDDLFSETIDRRALPGEGELDLARFARIFRDKGYAAPVSVEVLNREMRSMPREEFARRVYESAIRYWS
ncbi:MAG: sugar phosphate isomerase/epimerase [Deltaproteobacteria bacterium]|nr:sugar phosphate isomerase/epimerase [Deltaproteobacteria bacterium]